MATEPPAFFSLYVLLFATSGERAFVQGVTPGTVVAVVVSLLLLMQFLDTPFHKGVAGLRPAGDSADARGRRPGAHPGAAGDATPGHRQGAVR